MGKVRIALVGVGNCASSLVQGIHYYGEDGDRAVGLMHETIGGYGAGDVEVVAAFDIDARKVGADIADAIAKEAADIYRQLGEVQGGVAEITKLKQAS